MNQKAYAFIIVALMVVSGWHPGQGAAQGTRLTYFPLALEKAAIAPSTITASANGSSYAPHSSADGALVAFLSDASNLVPGDSNGVTDAFVWERDTGQFRRASIAGDGTEGNGPTTRVWLSGNGRYVLFTSDAGNLAPGDTNATIDLFRHDLWLGVTVLVSVLPDGTAAGSEQHAAITADGNTIFFTSAANISGDPAPPTCVQGPCTALFRRDMLTGITTAALTEPDGTLTMPIREVFTSADGGNIVYNRIEAAGDVCIPDGACGTQYAPFIRRQDTATGNNTLVARSEYWQIAHAYSWSRVELRGASADGNTVAYWHASEGGSGSGGNSGVSLNVKVGTAEATSLYGRTYWTYPRTPEGGVWVPDLQFTASADGSVLIFIASDLSGENVHPQIPEDTNGYRDLFRKQAGTYGWFANPVTTNAAHPSLSADGQTLYFESVAAGNPDPNRSDIFVTRLP